MVKSLLLTCAGAWLLVLLIGMAWLGLVNWPESAITLLVRDTVAQFQPWSTLLVGIGLGAAPLLTGLTIYLLGGAKGRQRAQNHRLGAVGRFHWVAVPPSDRTNWAKSATEMWSRMRPALQRSDGAILLGRAPHAALEISAVEGTGIRWGVWAPDVRHLPQERTPQDLPGTLGNILKGTGDRTHVTQLDDPLTTLAEGAVNVAWAEYGLAAPAHYPLRTDFNTDPLLPLIATCQTDQQVTHLGLQVIVRPVGRWQGGGEKELAQLIQAQAAVARSTLTAAQKEKRLLIEQKLDQLGYEVVLRCYAAGPAPQRQLLLRLQALTDVLGQYQSPLNALVVIARGNDLKTLQQRAFTPRLRPRMVLNVGELAALYHLPNYQWSALSGIAWAPAAIIPPTTPVIVGWGEPE